jgi:ADP-heptose:LPS heptosyltransferase
LPWRSFVWLWPQKILDRIKAHLEPIWFVLSCVLPRLLITRRRPVLLARNQAMGDILCTLPAALQLKKRHAGAAFIYSCRKEYASLPRMGGVTDCAVANLNLRRMETTYRFLFAGIYKFTYGDEFEDRVSTESVIAEYCRQHDLPIVDTHAPLQIPPAALAKARETLAHAGFGTGGPVIAIHPGPSWTVREWPVESWTELVQALSRHGFDRIIQLGTGKTGAAIPGTFSLVNQLTIEESIALISRCDLFIGIDSGLLHVAVCVQTPVVGIFGPTAPQLRFARSVAQSQVVSAVPCQGCHHRIPRLHWIKSCPQGIACMKSIRAEEVLAASLARLKPAKSHAVSTPI